MSAHVGLARERSDQGQTSELFTLNPRACQTPTSPPIECTLSHIRYTSFADADGSVLGNKAQTG